MDLTKKCVRFALVSGYGCHARVGEMCASPLNTCEHDHKPQPDELGKLIELCNERLSSEGAMADISFLNSIKILAERVSQQQNVNNMQAANNREVYNRAYVLEDRIKKLEERESRCHGDPESGDPADINQNPQANNPLTKEEILAILTYAPEWECDDRTCNQAVAKLYSYLEK